MTDVLLHTLSLPEVIWLNFFREFFSENKALLFKSSGVEIPNRFFLDMGVDSDNRAFDVILANDFKSAATGALPRLVCEDAGGAQQLGLTIGQVSNWSHSPRTIKERSDVVRFTYVFHCLSKDRGESRALASIVTKAMTVFREVLLASGLQHIEPWSVGTTQPLRSDSDEDYCDTPVQVTFTTMEHWFQHEIGTALGAGTAQGFSILLGADRRTRFTRASMVVADPVSLRFTRAAMTVQAPNAARFVRLGLDVEAPLDAVRFVRAGLVVEAPTTSTSFVRAEMRVS